MATKSPAPPDDLTPLEQAAAKALRDWPKDDEWIDGGWTNTEAAYLRLASPDVVQSIITQLREARQEQRRAEDHALESARKLIKAEADNQALREVLVQIERAVGDVWGDVENCEDCAAVDAFGEGDSACRVHLSQPLWLAMMAVWEVLGPCPCGHPRSRHRDEDSTACRECACQVFRLPTDAALTDRSPR